MFRIIAGSARADGLKRGATRALLLASTALATGIFAGAMVNPQTAQAQAQVSRCTLSPTGSQGRSPPARTFAWVNVVPSFPTATVTCDTPITTNNLSPAQLFVPSAPAPLAGFISPGVTVGGAGLSFEVRNNLSNSLSVSNAGTVTTARALNALQLIGSGGDVVYTGNGSVTNTGSGTSPLPPEAETTYGALNITNTGTGNVFATIGGNISATGGTAIATKTEKGNSTININSIIQGIGSVANPVISATSVTGTTTINNSGVIRSTNGDAKDLAISSPVTTGQIVINNAGTLLGRISLTDGNDVFNNIGTWTASDGAGPAANFGGGLNTLNNSGTINMASTFAGIETINNGVGGVINAGNIPGAGSAMFTTSKVQTVNNVAR